MDDSKKVIKRQIGWLRAQVDHNHKMMVHEKELLKNDNCFSSPLVSARDIERYQAKKEAYYHAMEFMTGAYFTLFGENYPIEDE